MRALSQTLIGAALWAASASALADWYVVVHPANPQPAMTQREVLALFTGRTRTFPGGEPAQPLDLPRGSAQRRGFYEALTGMDVARVDSYWSRLQFSGQVQPPLPMASETQAIAHVKRNAQAIAYLATPPQDGQLRVVHVLRNGAP